jgi:hypothetical protein
MANQGAKKRKEENARHMANIRRIIIACNVSLFAYYYFPIFSSFLLGFTTLHGLGMSILRFRLKK